MSTSVNAVLGVLFLFLAFLATYLMFQFWGYPYDEEKKKSSCPQWKMNIHRGVGFAYALVYVILMIQMVPRLWTYQVEFPARTVIHIVCGMGIGIVLILKISILRFFRHFEEAMPALGISLLILTVILSGLSLPFVFKERALAAGAQGGSVISKANRARVSEQLAKIDFGEKVDVGTLASVKGLQRGRDVLLEDCVYCHDLKTAISKPRTASDWWRTVKRMGDKPTLGRKLKVLDQQHVTAYLVAITPDLQSSAKKKREAAIEKDKTAQAMKKAVNADSEPDAGPAQDGGTAAPTPADKPVDMAKAKEVFEDMCSQCHELSDVEDAPPKTKAEVDEMIERMIENGLEADEPMDLELVRAYLNKTYVK